MDIKGIYYSYSAAFSEGLMAGLVDRIDRAWCNIMINVHHVDQHMDDLTWSITNGYMPSCEA